MISMALDIFGAYLTAKNIKSIWIGLLIAIVIGIASCVIVFFVKAILLTNTISFSRAASDLMVGFFLHPIISIIALIVCRKKLKASKI